MSPRASLPPPRLPGSPLGPPRYGLLTLFVLMSLVGVGITVFQAVGPIWSWLLLLVLMVVGAHVAGNALGSRLRDGGRVTLGEEPHQRGDMHSSETGARQLAAEHFAPVTRLSDHAPLGRALLGSAAIAGVLCALGGCWLLRWIYPHEATLPVLAVGGGATGAIGGFFAYWLGSLLQVFCGAWWQAHRHSEDQR